MRSTNPNATHFLLKRNLFIGVIVFLTVFFTLPFWGLSHIPMEKESILQYYDVQDQAKSLTSLVSSRVMTSPMNLEMMTAVYGGLGFLCAMMLLRHLFSRRQGLLHAALPDRRETDFLRRCLGYVVLCLAPIVLNFGLYLLIVAANGLLPYVAWKTLLPKFGLLLLINVYGFAMGLLSSVLTGTYWAALLAGAVLVVGMEVMAFLWQYLAGRYLLTLVSSDFSAKLSGILPTMSLYKGFYRPAAFAWLPGVLSILLALGLSYALYRVRKTEVTERTLAFPWLHSVMGFVLPLMGGSLLGVIVLMSFETEISLIVGLVLGAALTFWVCRMVFQQRFCGILEQWYLPAAAAAVLVLGVAALHTDVMGFDHFLPEREELTAISYHPRSYDTDEYITLTSDEALDAAYEWCSLMRGEVDGYENGINAFSHRGGASSVVVTYQLGGRTVQRIYPNETVRNAAQPWLQTVIESEDYKQSLIREYHLEDGTVDHLYLNSHASVLNSDEFSKRFGVFPDYMNLSREEDALALEDWLAALKKDIQNRTLAEKQEDAILTLGMQFLDSEDRYLYKSAYIYPGDTHFLSAVFGTQAQAIIDYATGGYAASEDVVALRVTYSMSREALANAEIRERDAVQSVELAASPEEAANWVRSAQTTYADSYYYMPDYEDVSYSRLYLYRMSDVERYQSIYNYVIPEDKSQLYQQQEIPVGTVLNFIEQ